MADITAEELEEIEREFHSGPGNMKQSKEFADPEELYQDLVDAIHRYHPSADLSLIERAHHEAIRQRWFLYPIPNLQEWLLRKVDE